MNPQIALTLAILALAVLLFVTERLRVDLVALLVLGSLALTGLVTPTEAVSGFSNPAVITVWAVFILSGALTRTGVTNVVGRQVLRLGARSENRLLIVIMLTVGIMSAFMNNVGVAAMLLPVVLNIARRTGHPRARLLMPLAYGTLLGGLTTLIGTPPNILASAALEEFGLDPFQFFDFAPVGVVILLAGILYMVLIGKRLLTVREDPAKQRRTAEETLGQVYGLRDLLFTIPISDQSPLAGKTLAESRLGAALGLNVFGIIRNGLTQLAPEPHTLLNPKDQLLVLGSLDRLDDLHGWSRLDIMPGPVAVQNLISEHVALAEIRFSKDASLVGKTVEEADFRRQYGLNVLAIWRDKEPLRSNLQNQTLLQDDILLVQVRRPQLPDLRAAEDFTIRLSETPEKFKLDERLLTLGIPDDSSLIEKTLAETRLGDAFDLTVLAVQRNGTRQLIPEATDRLMAGDRLLVEGRDENVNLLMGLQDILIDRESLPDFQALESEQIGLVEVVLAPHATLFSKTLRQLHFREKYGLNVMAIWRSGKAYHTDLRNMALRFGDALLLFGRREKLQVLADEPDFLILTDEIQAPPLVKKAPLAALIMAGVVISVLVGWLPISIAAVVGAALMVLTGSLTMEEAYRAIDWRAVFLIAGMLPLGIAMETSGAAQYLAELVVNGVGGLGSTALVAGIFLLTSLSSQIMPNAVVTVLMAPIAINTALDLQLSPYALMMVVAIAASASFLSPVGHPSNILVMGPGGYRFVDYIKVGLPLTIIVLIITLLVLPIFWPLVP